MERQRAPPKGREAKNGSRGIDSRGRIPERLCMHEVKKFRAVPEITHRRWKELGLMKPLEPDQTAQYKFSDLQMSLYYTIYI